jgi:tRNA pseudouridine13 synthase
MVERLREDPRDFAGALLSLDRRLRAMVVFEFQSALWNDAVVRYLRRKIAEKDLVVLRYQLGSLFFPRALPKELQRGWARLTFPLLAPETVFHDPDIQAASEAALAREKLTLAELHVPKVKAFHFKTEERPLVVVPGKLRASEPRPDELNRGRQKVVLSFTLPPGAYATLVVRRVCWFATEEHEGVLPRRVSVRPVAQEVPETAPKGFLQRQREKKERRRESRAEVGRRK